MWFSRGGGGQTEIKYKLFSIIPILKIKLINKTKRIYYFLNIPIFTLKGNITNKQDTIKLIDDKIKHLTNTIIINGQTNLNIYNLLSTKYHTRKINTDNTKIPIFFANNNNNNIHALSVAIISILENTNSFCEFYVLESDVTNNCKQKLETIKDKYGNFSLEWIRVNPSETFKDLSVDCANGGKHSWNSYYDIYTRFLIPDLKPSVDKAIYLDYDVVVLGDIKELFTQDLGEYLIGGVNDKYSSRTYILDIFAIPHVHNYFGSGILLMDCKGLRGDGFLNKMLKLGIKWKEKLIFPDQDMLNIYFAVNNYKLLDYKFGVLNGTTNEEIIIQHFNGLKPWKGRSYNKYSWNEWWYYAVKSPFYQDILTNFN